MSIQYHGRPSNIAFDIQNSIESFKFKIDDLYTIINQISPGSGSGSSSGSNITLQIPATQLTLSNPRTGNTLTI
jgi:hypothetical protein